VTAVPIEGAVYEQQDAQDQSLVDDDDINDIAAQHEASINGIFKDASHSADIQSNSNRVGAQMKCPPLTSTMSGGEHLAKGKTVSSDQRMGLPAIECGVVGSASECLQAMACKDGTCNCKGTISTQGEMNPSLTTDHQKQIREYAKTISVNTKNMTAQVEYTFNPTSLTSSL